MPYDLPLTPYDAHDEAWCNQLVYNEPDMYGDTWPII